MTIHICLVMVAMVIVIGRQKDRDDYFQGLVVAMVRRIAMFGVSWSSGVRIRVRIRDEFSLK
jgi:hypothetical protein